MLPWHKAIILADPDADKLIIFHNPLGSLTFDPTLTTSVSTTVIWQTEAGTTVTTGTSHALSYTPTAGPKVCKVTVLAGLGAVTAFDCRTDLVTSIKNLPKCRPVSAWVNDNPNILIDISDVPYCNYLYGGVCIKGNLINLSRGITYFNATVNTLIYGSLSDLPATSQTIYLYSDTNITPASIAHLIAIRDIRIYTMGWTAQQNTDVLLSAWGARANYTYASGIALRIGAPTGTPGTEPPAEGESNSDWSWNAGTSRHDPLTGYAAIADLQADYYDEGFKGWAVTIV